MIGLWIDQLPQDALERLIDGKLTGHQPQMSYQRPYTEGGCLLQIAGNQWSFHNAAASFKMGPYARYDSYRPLKMHGRTHSLRLWTQYDWLLGRWSFRAIKAIRQRAARALMLLKAEQGTHPEPSFVEASV